MKYRPLAILGFGTAFLAGLVTAVLTALPGMAAINDALTCITSECADLAAQRSMSAAAWAMVALTALATLIGGGSLALIGLTLRATSKAALAAMDTAKAANRNNQIAIADRRPWVTIRREVECDFSAWEIPKSRSTSDIFKYKAQLAWWYSIENLGRSPAFGVRISQKIVASSNYLHAAQQLRTFVDAIDADWATRTELTIFPHEELGISRGEIHALIRHEEAIGEDFFLLAAVAYRTQDSEVVGLEGRIWLLDFNNEVHGPKAAKLIEYVEARITR